MIKIAAHDSCSLSKSKSDFICDGIADEGEIIAAQNLLGVNGGEIKLSEGNFNFSNQFPNANKPMTIAGSGMRSTVLKFPVIPSCIVPRIGWTMRDFEIIGSGSEYGIQLPLESYYGLYERIYITGVIGAGVRGEPGNSQNTFKGVIVRGEPDYGFNAYGVTNQFYYCQAMRTNDKGGGIAAFCLHITGDLLTGCSAEDWAVAYQFDNYCEDVAVYSPHIEDCPIDFQMTGATVAPKKIRVYAGLHGGVVSNPGDMDIIFYE